MAILLTADLKPTTHNGAKSNFTEFFIKPNKIPKEYVKTIHSFSPGGKKGIMMIYSILTKKKFYPISNLFLNSLN